MASILKVDTITGVSTAGSIAVTGEGNSTTTNLQQGLAKSWCNLQGNSTAAIRDSFNTASITDNGTGDYRFTFTSAMNNVNYSTDCSHSALGTDYRFIVLLKGSTSALSNYTTSQFEVLGNQVQNGTSAADFPYVGVGINGDLA